MLSLCWLLMLGSAFSQEILRLAHPDYSWDTIAKLVVHRVPTDDNGMETGNSTVTLVVSNFRSAPYRAGDSEFPPRSSLVASYSSSIKIYNLYMLHLHLIYQWPQGWTTIDHSLCCRLAIAKTECATTHLRDSASQCSSLAEPTKVG